MKPFKEVWNADIISGSCISEWIKMFLDEWPTPTYEEELQRKLNIVRAKIEYDATWYTPTFDELKEGDTLEIQTSFGWWEGKWPRVLFLDTHTRLWGGNTIESRFKYASLRKRITNEQQKKD